MPDNLVSSYFAKSIKKKKKKSQVGCDNKAARDSKKSKRLLNLSSKLEKIIYKENMDD